MGVQSAFGRSIGQVFDRDLPSCSKIDELSVARTGFPLVAGAVHRVTVFENRFGVGLLAHNTSRAVCAVKDRMVLLVMFDPHFCDGRLYLNPTSFETTVHPGAIPNAYNK